MLHICVIYETYIDIQVGFNMYFIQDPYRKSATFIQIRLYKKYRDPYMTFVNGSYKSVIQVSCMFVPYRILYEKCHFPIWNVSFSYMKSATFLYGMFHFPIGKVPLSYMCIIYKHIRVSYMETYMAVVYNSYMTAISPNNCVNCETFHKM